MGSSTIVRFVDVSFKYKNEFIIENFSFNLDYSETLFVNGLTDKERSFLMMLILGVESSDSGDIELFGENISSLKEKDLHMLRSKIGYVQPQGGLLSNLTVRENILLPLIYHSDENDDEIDDKLYDVLKLLDILEYIDYPTWKLNNFLTKKVLIARAVINKPAILLIDEPTTYIEKLDIPEIMDIIEYRIYNYIDREKSSVIITTEDETWCNDSSFRVIKL